MTANLLQVLVQLTIVSTATVLVVGALRKPLRRAAGARAAYWLWLTVPATSLAVLLPVPMPATQALAHSLLPALSRSVSGSLESASATGVSARLSEVGALIWLAGAIFMAVWLTSRQRTFVRSLGRLLVSPDGIFRSERIAAPMLVGAWHPRVIVPVDFEVRYPERDRQLMLAHEQAHQERGDAFVSSIAAAWLCAFWFNPLMYWALGRIRFDQELACDALVVSRSHAGKQRYANALLRAQLTYQSAWRMPAGCHWQSNHPLKERIAMLKLRSPAPSRRIAGITFTFALAVSGMYFVSASYAQAAAQTKSAESADRKFAIDAENTDTREVLKMIASKGARNVLVGDQVGGKITIHLKDVTWREALDIVVQSQGLVVRESGNMTIVDVPRKPS
jgi:bla regulator protein BlaR1